MKDLAKELVKLRTREIKNGILSLYLDYTVDGKRKFEFLKLYLRPENNRADKTRNKETLALANSIKAARTMDLEASRLGFSTTAARRNDVLFFDYFMTQIERRAGTTRLTWTHVLKHLQIYERNRSLRMCEVDKAWVEGFRQYLDTKACLFDIDDRKHIDKKKYLAAGSKALYFQKLSTCFNSAIKDGVIDVSPMRNVDRFKMPDSEREYLTLDELKVLAATYCDKDVVKRAFLFSALTGMRWSDISRLRWNDISCTESGMRITFRQQKTKGLVYLDISRQAAELLEAEERGSGLVFPSLVNPAYARLIIERWVARSGLRKHITFHCARHTFAVMMLDLGTDIYTLSKLLGHKDLTSTQIYAKILDKNKRAAVEKIPKIF